jgi:uncharacterized membrane protein
MQSKLLTCAAALALSATAVLATAAPASAQRSFGWYGGPVYGDDEGNAYDRGYVDPGYAYDRGYDPGYAYGTAPGSDDAYCAQRFRSYDPASGTYLGYDGLRHSCP